MLELANAYQCRPSALMDVEDPYTAYCFDEACVYIVRKINDDKEPTFRANYKSFKDMYRQYD